MVRRLDPWFVLIDYEKQREGMSVSIKKRKVFTNHFCPQVRCLDRQIIFTSPALIRNFDLFFCVPLIIRFHLCFLKLLVWLLSSPLMQLKYIFNEVLDAFKIIFRSSVRTKSVQGFRQNYI